MKDPDSKEKKHPAQLIFTQPLTLGQDTNAPAGLLFHDVISMRIFPPPAGANSNRLHKRSIRRRSKGVSSRQEQRKLL